MKTLLIFALLLCSVDLANAAAATYYVNAATGNDANTTTQAQNPATPWLTLQHASDASANGDTIHIATGTYTESGGGIFAWYIAGSKTWIADGAVTVKGTGAGSRTTYLRNSTGGSSFSGITFDGVGVADAVNSASGITNITFSSCTFSNATAELVAFGGPASTINYYDCTFQTASGVALNNAVWGGTVSNCTFSVTGSSVLVDKAGSIISNNVTASVTSDLFKLVTSTGNILFDGNVVTISGGTPRTLLSNNGASTAGTLTVRNNTVTNSTKVSDAVIDWPGTGGWTVSITNNLFHVSATDQAVPIVLLTDPETVLVSGNSFESLGTNAVNHVGVTSTGTNCTSLLISNNTFRTRSIAGYCVRVGTDSSTAGDEKLDAASIVRNTLYGPNYYDPSFAAIMNTHMIFFGFSKNATISRNYVLGGGYGLVLKGEGIAWTAGSVDRNVFNQCACTAGTIRIKSAQNVPFICNTINILDANTPAFVVTTNGTAAGSTGLMLTNNAVLASGSDLMQIDTNSIPALKSDYNGWSATTASPFLVGGTNLTFSVWASDFGVDGNSVNQAFRWVSSTDPQPLFCSPLINRGANMGMTVDFLGNPVPVGTIPDIGAYEYQAIVIPIATANRLIIVP